LTRADDPVATRFPFSLAASAVIFEAAAVATNGGVLEVMKLISCPALVPYIPPSAFALK
jgi:hypothetical protein